MSRLDSPYHGADGGILTATDGTPTGVTKGEQTISASTTLPTTAEHAQFVIAGYEVGSSPPVQLAAPKAVSMGVRLEGAGAPTATQPFRLGFWNPTTEKWYMTSMFTALGDDNLDDNTQALDGNVYFAMCPRWATLGMVHVPDLTASVDFIIVVARDRQ